MILAELIELIELHTFDGEGRECAETNRFIHTAISDLR